MTNGNNQPITTYYLMMNFGVESEVKRCAKFTLVNVITYLSERDKVRVLNVRKTYTHETCTEMEELVLKNFIVSKSLIVDFFI